MKAIFPYSSERKMMSIIVKTIEGEYVLYSKGSDEKILPLLNTPEDERTEIQK